LKERKGKLLEQELHNDMILPINKGGFAGVRDEEGNIIVSNNTLLKILPIELRPMTEMRKQLCG
jgi:hypothetical protein